MLTVGNMPTAITAIDKNVKQSHLAFGESWNLEKVSSCFSPLLPPSDHVSLQATEEKYVVTPEVSEASIVIKNTKEPPLTLTIHLTSPVVREEMEKLSAGGKLQHQGWKHRLVLLQGD